MLASSSQASDFTYISRPTIMDALPNTHVFWLEPEETHRGYGCHAFHPSGVRTLNKETIPIIHHQGLWYTLRHKAGLAYPHLGAKRPDISLYDVPIPTASIEPEVAEPDPVEQAASTVTIPAITPTFSSTSRPAASPEAPRDTSSSHVPLGSHVIHPHTPLSRPMPCDPVSRPRWVQL